MDDYTPLDLSAFANTDADFLGLETRPPLGATSYRGLPFTIGGSTPDPQRCLIGFASGETPAPVTITVGQAARWLIFAHTLLESQLREGDQLGRVVAHYLIRYADGEEIAIPIRERFEVARVPTWWGGMPFVAVPDENESKMSRYSGKWSEIGERQAETFQGFPAHFYLWAWQSPRPDQPIESITVSAAGRKFALAALTLSRLDEEPLRRVPKREVTITLTRPEDAERPFGLEVDVDRGVATYPFALPTQSADAFVEDPMGGWGEEQNKTSSPAYVEVAARPSASITLRNGEEPLATVGWGDLETQGKIETPRARFELVDQGRNWVRVTVLDEETGQPVPCRIHFRSPQGIPYQPHGHHNHVNANLDSWHSDIGGDLRLGQISYAYIDGACEGWLPRGDVIVDAARGFEYEPLRARLRIEPGQRELTLRLKRWTNMSARGWYSGDTHVHFLGAHGAHREAQGEDLHVVNLLQSQWGRLFTNHEDALGPTFSNDGKTIVYTTQENRQHLLGHLTLLGLKQPVMPWCTDGPDEAELGGTLEVTMADWADRCHAQGGTVVIPHLPNPNGEPAALIATGRADAVEMIASSSYNHLEYYRYLNCGYRLPLVGGTDKMYSDVPVGLYRTYAAIRDEEFSYESWCRALRAGRTFLSGGPILSFSVEGEQIGDTLRLPAGGGTLEVEASAESIFPMHTLEIVQEGRVVASTEATDSRGARRLTLRAAIRVNRDSWLAARCGGPRYHQMHSHFDAWRRGIFAHTSPIYVAVANEWRMFDRATAEYMLTLVGGSLEYIRGMAALHTPGSTTHHHGEDDHLAYLERPFHEAAAAIHRRMHELGIAH